MQTKYTYITLLLLLLGVCTAHSQENHSEVAADFHERVAPAQGVSSGKKPFVMALKTNALYSLLAIPNVGAEFCLGRNYSVAGNWHYAWWHSDSQHWYHRTYGGEVSVRKWFPRPGKHTPLSGHHLGVYGQMLTYDFLWGEDSKGNLSDRWNYAVGLEYGYSLPVAKRLNLHFSLGLGYLSGNYMAYQLQDNCYVWQETRTRNYIGPTKAEVSLVWLIANKKGGAPW